MAGDWIKVEHTTPDKPEVVKLADMLGIDQDAVVGKLLRLWIWADQQSVSGNAITVTNSFLDRLVFCPGFAVGLVKVGWLNGRNGLLSIPNFDRHNGQTAKNRANTNRRVANHRKGRNDETVTDVTPEPLQKPLPEKRREENNNIGENTAYSRQRALPEDSDKVKAYLQAEALRGRLLLNESQFNELMGPGRKYVRLLIFVFDKCHQLLEIRLVKFFLQTFSPTFIYSNIHGVFLILPPKVRRKA